MKSFVRFLVALYLCLFCAWLSIPVQAQTKTTPNLINPDGTYWGIPSNQILNNGQIGQVEGAGPTSGSAYYNSSTNTIRFSYNPSVVAQTIAINQALSGTGIQVNGFNWYYLWMNGGYSSGLLSGGIAVTNSSGEVVESHSFNHPVQPTDTWNVESGTRTFNNPYAVSSLGNITMSFYGQDDRYWNGLYGPRVRDPNLTLNYTVNQCAINPLSSPDCPGYATAYFNQQCTISSLYNPACPGYAIAYHDQQCSINPLYASDCFGYQEAYAKKNLLNTTTSTTETTVKTDPVSIATTSTTTSTTSPTSVTSVTSVISGGTSSATTTTITAPNTVQSTPTQTAPASTTDTKATAQEIKSASSGSSGPEAKSRAERRAKEVAKAASEAKTIEAQAATQGLVVGLMGYVPGFDAYSSARIADTNALDMQRQYSRPVVDNRNAMRQLSGTSDNLHREMTQQQYTK